MAVLKGTKAKTHRPRGPNECRELCKAHTERHCRRGNHNTSVNLKTIAMVAGISANTNDKQPKMRLHVSPPHFFSARSVSADNTNADTEFVTENEVPHVPAP
jgi:hypothetical protein